MPLIRPTQDGLYCERGDFYIDPWRPVKRALITHGHADHARPGSQHYLAVRDGAPILRHRLGSSIQLQEIAYGDSLSLGDVKVSFSSRRARLGSRSDTGRVSGRSLGGFGRLQTRF